MSFGRAVALALLLMMTSPGAARAAQSADGEKVSLAERVWMASKMYSAVQIYFGHFQAVPNLDLDAAYRKYLEQALASDDRLSFDLASLEFFAALENGHSGFNDRWLSENYGQPLGFVLARFDGQWVVTRSRVDRLAPGEVVSSIGSVPMDEFYAQKRKYLAASNETARHRRLFSSPFLFPENFALTLADGRMVAIRRREQKLKDAAPRVTEGRELEPGIAYLRIPSFEAAEEEAKAVEFVRRHAGVKALIVDVRGNGGGVTPSDLIRALMDRPYRELTEASPMSFALFGAYRQVLNMVKPEQITERNRGSLEALGGYSNPQLVTPGELRQPEKPLYTGKVLILTDSECASACEDFVAPFKVSGRGRILGQATTGSTGQPFFFDFGNGMTFRVSAKRVFFPDGSQFEGVGVTPDLPLQPSPADMRAGVDIVLNRALELARAN